MTEARLDLFVHVEEPSMKEVMDALLRVRLDMDKIGWKVIDHGSKDALLRDVPKRMKGYANWPHAGLRVLVLVDRDDDDCLILKRRLETAALSARLHTKSSPDREGRFKVVNRVVIEELEAWFFGDVPALAKAFPGVSPTLGKQARFRDPDAIRGGTWEALRQVLNKAGYYVGSGHLPKIAVARSIASLMDVNANASGSFRAFWNGLDALIA